VGIILVVLCSGCGDHVVKVVVDGEVGSWAVVVVLLHKPFSVSQGSV
jgi:hypothetical protein